jgi:hypothetical protein
MRLHHPQGTKRAQAKIRNRAAMRRISLNALFAAFLPPAIGTGLIFGGIFAISIIGGSSRLSWSFSRFSRLSSFCSSLGLESLRRKKGKKMVGFVLRLTIRSLLLSGHRCVSGQGKCEV